MKKRLYIFLFVLVFCVVAASGVFAGSRPARVVDEADLLSASEEAELLSLLDEISERHRVDVAVVTVNSLGGKTPRAFADDYYDNGGYGFGASADGMLLVVAMSTRDYYITTSGYGIEALTDAGIAYISDRFVGDLSDGDYIGAFTTYAELCDDFITEAKSGEAYDGDHMPKEPYNVLKSLGVSLVIGFVIALIVTAVMRSQLKTVRRKSGASDYVKQGSFRLTHSSDLFLYRRVTRRARPKNESSGGGSSTHSSSSGRSHGGGGGKF